MRNINRLRICVITCICLLASSAAGLAGEAAGVEIAEIQKYGNLVLSISGTDFLALGYAYGDIVTVHINGEAYDMPVCTNYSDVDNGSMVCRVDIDPEAGADHVMLAINMGDLATAAGIAAKLETEESPGYRWEYAPDIRQPLTVTISMKEPGGYAAEYQVRQLMRSNERADYPQLDDMQFANFREITTSGMGMGVLYRTSSPVNPELGRSEYADAALAGAGVRTVVNLADDSETCIGYEGYAGSAYSACNVIALNLSVDVLSDSFESGLAEGLRFMIANEGPYAVHCTEGKDRAGFVSAVLECLMGASADEVVSDYMTTYYNYYGVEPGTEAYDRIASIICETLAGAFHLADIAGADLAAEAEAYMLDELGLSAAEISALKSALTGN